MNNEIKASPEQNEIYEWVSNARGSAQINAVAGSGKSTTVKGSIKLVKGNVAIMAFNKPIADEIEAKINKIKGELYCRVSVGTFHRFGLSAIKTVFKQTRIADDQEKIKWLLENTQIPGDKMKGIPYGMQSFVTKAYNLARQWGAGISPEFPYSRAEAWFKLIEHFDLRNTFADRKGNLPEEIEELVKKAINATVYVLKEGEKIANELIDFEDFIWFPIRLNLKMWQYDWVFIDECQDMNISRRIFVARVLKINGRALFVGDPHQAIYGFTGADAESFQRIKEEFGCTEKGLTYSFRCSKSVVVKAQKWVPHIKFAPDAPEGATPTITEKEFIEQYVSTLTPKVDAIICRNNAPLISLFFKLLKQGIVSRIEGKKDVAKKLTDLINRFDHFKKIPTLISNMEEYRQKQVTKYMTAGKESDAGDLNDTVEAILAVIDNLPKKSTVDDLLTKIDSLFIDLDSKTGFKANASFLSLPISQKDANE